MSSVNKVILIGRLGRDPEVRQTGSGKSVANFSIACDETWKDSSGERQKKTEWVNLVVWGPSVEAFVQPYLHKGDLVYAEGKLQTRSWDDKDGNKKYTTEVNVTDIKSLESKGDGGGKPPAARGNSNQKPAGRPAAQNPRREEPPAEVSDEDILF